MDIQPASIDQVRIGMDGKVVIIDAQASQVVADMQAIVPEVRVRFAEDANPPFWAVSTVSDDGRSHHLVFTAQAELTHSGTWAGLDDRAVKRVAQIDAHGRGHYDYAKEIDKQNALAHKRQEERRQERFAELGEMAQRDLRQALGPAPNRAFVPRSVS